MRASTGCLIDCLRLGLDNPRHLDPPLTTRIRKFLKRINNSLLCFRSGVAEQGAKRDLQCSRYLPEQREWRAFVTLLDP